jgi:hypothetical protein
MRSTVSQMKSKRLLAFYDGVRQRVEDDVYVGGSYRFAGDVVKQYAEELRKELERRQFKVRPIHWPD